MSPAQREALERVAAASEPVKVAAATARILHERYAYIEVRGDGWTLSERGRAMLDAEDAQERHREVARALSPEAREWAERVVAWMQAVVRIDRREHYAAYRYAEHVAACDHDGAEPVPVGQWADGAREWVESETRAAAQCLRDYDETAALAGARGVGVSVTFEADAKIPRSRHTAAADATRGNVLSLRTYRERRPDRDGAA